jgi:hypothetical protein
MRKVWGWGVIILLVWAAVGEDGSIKKKQKGWTIEAKTGTSMNKRKAPSDFRGTQEEADDKWRVGHLTPRHALT